MDNRNTTYLFLGFLAAWLIVMLYVIYLARKGARLQQDLDDLRKLVADNASEATRGGSVETHALRP